MQTTIKNTFGLLVCGLVLSLTQSATAADDAPDYRAFTVGAEAGTTGLGGSASWRFSDHFGVRGGVNYFSYDTDQFTYSTRAPLATSSTDQKFTTTLRLLSEPVALDFYPSAKSSFHISFGALINQNRFQASVTGDGVAGSTFDLNGTQYFQSAVNQLDLEVKQQTVSPYLSIGGNIYIGSSRHWSVNGELGVAYTGNPKVSLTSPAQGGILDTPNLNSNTPFTDDLNAESNKISDDAKDFKFYPIVKIGVSYSF